MENIKMSIKKNKIMKGNAKVNWQIFKYLLSRKLTLERN